jgi:hypothetical protein
MNPKRRSEDINVKRHLKTIAAAVTAPLIGLVPTVSAAQEALPWRLAEYPAGGDVFSNTVAEPLTGQPDLLVPTCRALAPGSVEQTASGFAGIGIAVATAPLNVAEEIVDELPECCRIVIGSGVDEKINFGASLALVTREIGEANIDHAREIERLIGLCGDETALRSYEVARGEDTLGLLIAQEDSDGPDTTGTIISTPPGGGLPSTN